MEAIRQYEHQLTVLIEEAALKKMHVGTLLTYCTAIKVCSSLLSLPR
jgi:hypothetical protein